MSAGLVQVSGPTVRITPVGRKALGEVGTDA